MNFLTFKTEVVIKTIREMVQAIEDGSIIIDPEVQRKLDHKRKRLIATYIHDFLEGKTFGAFFGPICASKRKTGVYAILDGQHRFFGAWEALIQIKREIKDTLENGNEDKERLNTLTEHATLIENSVIPMMAYIDLTKEQEQQFFHDTNNLGKKVSQSLTLSYNHSDPYVNLTRSVCEFDNLKDYIQPLKGKKDKDKLFTFKNIYTTVNTFIGKMDDFDTVQKDSLLEELEEFFSIVTDSFPEDVVTGDYLYKHAGILPGIALFANRMKKIEGVCWRNTLKNALSRVSFSADNIQFVRIGRALLDQERKKVTFSGSKGAISATVKTLEQESLRLDQNGNEVIQAYYDDNHNEPVVIVSDEVASKVEKEVTELIDKVDYPAGDEDSSEHPDNLSASQKAILNAIDSSESRFITGSYTQIAESLNFARSTTTDALKKLESMGLIEMTDDNGVKVVKRKAN